MEDKKMIRRLFRLLIAYSFTRNISKMLRNLSKRFYRNAYIVAFPLIRVTALAPLLRGKERFSTKPCAPLLMKDSFK